MNNKKEIVLDMIEQHIPYLLQRARYLLPNIEDAEDVVQDVFLAAYEGIDKYKGDGQVKTWLSSILNYKVADYYRKKYKQPGKISLNSYFDEDGQWKTNEFLKTWDEIDTGYFNDPAFKNAFEHCIENLPEKWSVPVKLYYLEEKKSDFVSQELGINTTNLWKILQRARLQLKDCLDSKWFNH
ncbi:sigma-70 family RNA polymerase sigma factor [Flavobacterium agricola]|uniref:RNA polymerase sigma factor n=1 Tax=Flavobacterium agricola TaxID=2870839 RepID=A0ABY6LZG8_9FLAO|nr:sigma-70 family RNA polymerase sigma factor [Flavobacterium agricola]UYW00957.1 sigma-70 family RNA polymerase sigma factor [Flavobacterium agricola]